MFRCRYPYQKFINQLNVTVIKNNSKFIVGGRCIPPDLKSEIYQDLVMYYNENLDSYLEHKFICIGDFIRSKLNWLCDQNKSVVLFHSNTNSQNKYCSNFFV